MIFSPQRQQRNDIMFPQRQGYPGPARNNNLGGMLQKFIGQNQNFGQMATRGVDGISKTLNGVQQILRVVDTAAPIVKQYGPIVRNLPTMYRMVKAFKGLENNDTEEKSGELESQEFESLTSSSSFQLAEESSVERDGQSTPKLFI
ncbi:VrrA/YqfQ family protein [Ornithinibacillus scapharcae]|uniref:VrrA/YqfQ family protein n=1 Tax=Ornithinibacillus scapharcae TaxID=1147159 RepID=UPI000225B2FE|nr:VrrA/YqfQ family protein [Ornithinibacillus scapharcae]